ncbi:SGNH/GDSL hydrolase family protein [Rhizobium sp. CFBP 8762]|uniref:SGNH/GDSL hydrolase family protein n=1 Tax=Rhizobium sp. CFBP 8762 TaxID=2775279 RepID=UPI0017872831|nr:SGNH/GDSL hydrolase family protein [Rhizobium sp. CFBP 8762]MBD8556280.1 SGNH/GDSL hydrolase family protein [Rhizobium sp. CFBP 8762]
MAIKTINVGVKPNDGTGDPNRDAFIKANDNFQELFSNTDAAQVATDAEALQGIDDLRRMTPAKVRKFVESFVGSAGRKAIEFFATATERDAINAALTATNATVSTLADSVQGAAAGNVSAVSWSVLSAIVGTRVGQPATVADTDTGTHTDPVVGGTVSNAGEYAWSASPAGWRWVSNSASLVKTAVSPSALYFGSSPILSDWFGDYGQARTFYVNRTFFARTLKGATSLTIGTDSARIPGYTELQVSGTTTLYGVFINRLTGEITAFAQNAFPVLNDTQVHLFDVRGGIISNEDYPVIPIENGIGGLYAFNAFVIEENNTILVPRVSWNSRLFSSIRPTPAGMFEKEVTGFASSATGQVLYFDQIAAAKGIDPFIVASNPAWPESATTFPLVSKAGSASPYASPKGVPLIGAVPGGSVPNQANMGKNAVERATLLYRTTLPCDITNADLIALGFTRGVNDTTYYTPYYGNALKDPTAGALLHARFYVQSDADNNFPVMQARWLDANGATITTVTASIEKQIGLRAASYFVRGAIPDGATGVWFGTIAAANRDIRLCGLQMHSGARVPLWILRSDYPAPVDASGSDPTTNPAVKQAILLAGDKSDGKLLYPSEMFLIEGREQKLYGDQLFETRTDGQDVFMTLEARSMMANNEWPLPASGKRELTVKGGALAASTALVTRTISQASKDNRSLRELNVRTAGLTALTGSSSTALFIGDSLTEFTGYPQAAGRELAKAGMTLNFTGTVDIREADAATGGQNIVKGEGRGSRDIRNYTYQDGTGAAVPCDPFPDSFIATYLAMSTTDKKAYNPFLRPATGADPADRVFNGYIFDMRFYLTRFGLADPAIVVFNLGTNDINHGGLPAQSAAVATGIKVLIAQTLLALPNAYVGLVVNPLPRTVSGDSKWSQQVMLYKILQAAALARTELDGAGRPRVSLIPAYAHCTPDTGYTETAGDTDPATGAKTVSMTDPLHYKGTVKEQVGRAVAAWIACRKVGA